MQMSVTEVKIEISSTHCHSLLRAVGSRVKLRAVILLILHSMDVSGAPTAEQETMTRGRCAFGRTLMASVSFLVTPTRERLISTLCAALHRVAIGSPGHVSKGIHLGWGWNGGGKGDQNRVIC